MDLNALYAELLEAAGTIDGLRVNPTDSRAVNPPAVIPATPTVIDYDRTYGGSAGLVRVELILTVVASPTTVRSGVSELLALTSPSGSRSIKQALESAEYTVADSVSVLRTEDFGALPISGIDYLAANLVVEVYGKAAD